MEGVRTWELYKVYHCNSLLLSNTVTTSPDRLLPLLFLSLPKPTATHYVLKCPCLDLKIENISSPLSQENNESLPRVGTIHLTKLCPVLDNLTSITHWILYNRSNLISHANCNRLGHKGQVWG